MWLRNFGSWILGDESVSGSNVKMFTILNQSCLKDPKQTSCVTKAGNSLV